MVEKFLILSNYLFSLFFRILNFIIFYYYFVHILLIPFSFLCLCDMTSLAAERVLFAWAPRGFQWSEGFTGPHPSSSIKLSVHLNSEASRFVWISPEQQALRGGFH